MWPVNHHSWNFHAPKDVESDDDGNIYIADEGYQLIFKYNGDGDLVTSWGGSGSLYGKFGKLSGMALDSSGYIYLTDSDLSKVNKFTTNGEFVKRWSMEGSPEAITLDQNYIYLIDSENYLIRKFDKEGLEILTWGGQGGRRW